jgi:hypothetical protein
VRERLNTLLCALGALLVFVTLFVHGGPAEMRRSAPPTTSERSDNGLFAARRWLEAEGLRAGSLRERFDALEGRNDLPRSGNLLIVSIPVVNGFKSAEVRALDRWVRAGNTLLVLAALSDRPAWSVNGAVHGDLQTLTGLQFVAAKRQPDSQPEPRAASRGSRRRSAEAPFAQLAQPLRSTLVANRPHPYLSGVESALAFSDFPHDVWEVAVPRAGFVLAIAHERELGEGVLWVRPADSGTIVISAFSSLFSNRALGLADNARLFANIVTASLGPGGAVLFDDTHQGLTATYDPAKFYRDPRLYATLGVLLAVWFAWVLGGTRLRPATVRAGAPREAELVRVTGMFLARVLPPAAAARRLFEHFFRRLQRLTGRHLAEGPPWEWLENHSRLSSDEVRQLRTWYADAYSERRLPLQRVHNLIVRIERLLAA